jgi:membrane fusion protein (multidrug efflux system)
MNTLQLNRPLFFLAGILALLISLSGCVAKAKEPATSKPAAAPQATPVDGTIIQPSILTDDIEITGTLVANQQVDIVSELTRKITVVHAKEGTVVKAGDLLFQLDDADLKAQLEKLRQQEKLALLNEERLHDLIKHEAVVQQDYDQAFTNLKVLQAQILELQVLISKTRIKAPFAGKIGLINTYPGAVVSTNTVLANIQDNSLVKIDFNVPEKYTNTIASGSEQKFTVTSDHKQYTARVISREAKLDPNTRTLLVRAIARNPGNTLIPGQSARLNLSLRASTNALMVSSQAMIPSSQGYSVYVSRNNQVQLVPIEIGQRNPYAVEVLKGLQQGDTVITSNLLRLMPGSAVRFVTLK